MVAKKQETIAKKITEELLDRLGVGGKVAVLKDKDNEAVKIQVETEDPGILIGRHGDTIESLQVVLGQILYQRTGEWYRVLVNVGDYRERREEALRSMATSTALRAKQTGRPQELYDLKPSERRLIHMVLSDDKEVTTESEGEGRDRRLVIRPQK